MHFANLTGTEQHTLATAPAALEQWQVEFVP